MKLTNYIDRVTGIRYHGSELSYTDRFKSDRYEKIETFSANQNQPFADRLENNEWIICRKIYGKKVEITRVKKEK